MANTQNPSSGAPDFSSQDLQDPSLFKLNSTIKLLWGKISTLYQSGGTAALGATIQAPVFQATSQPQPPAAGSNILLTRASADELYAPTAQRTALASGAYQSGPAQPLPPGGGGGTTANPVSYIEASQYCGGGGLSDICINNAIAALPSTGGAIHLRSGTWTINNPVKGNVANVILFGDGNGTVLTRGSSMPSSKGMIDITTSGWVLRNFVLDGVVTTSTGLLYNTAPPNGFNITSPETGSLIDSPMASTLTTNTSVWVHGVGNFTMYGVTVQRTGGYAVLIDATTTTINNVVIDTCSFLNNIPTLFGTSAGDKNYGSWNGGVLAVGGTYIGGAGTLSYVSGFVVTNCYWYNNTGNCLWSWAPQLVILHNRLSWNANTLQDCGLDGIQPGAAQGGSVDDNTLYRVGYVGGNPKYLTGYNATAIDTTGMVRGFSYSNNTIIQPNGGGFSLDNLCDSTVTGNSIFISPPSDHYYSVDQVASYGPGGAGNYTSGIVCNNSYDVRGGDNLTISNNSIRNMGINAIVVFNNRNSTISGNNIVHPATASGVPIDVANLSITGTVNTSGTAVSWVSGAVFNTQWVDCGYAFIFINSVRYQIASASSTTSLTLATSAGTQSGVSYAINPCQNNTVSNNSIYYNGPSWCIYEDSTYGALTGPNFYYGNRCVGSNYGEVLLGSSSGNTSQANFVFTTNSSAATSQSSNFLQREGFGSSAAFKVYSLVGGTKTQVMQLSDAAFLNISTAGAAGTGVLATGNRASSVFNDTVVTSRLYGDGFLSLTDSTFTYPNDPAANLLSTNAWGLIRYNSTTHAFEQSVSVSGGNRVWTTFGGGGTPGGSDTDIQYNKSSAFAGDGNLVWAYGPQIMTITGSSASGTATTTGTTTVTAATGTFNTGWTAGTSFVLNGTAFSIASVTNATHLVLSSTPPTYGSPVAWSVTLPVLNALSGYIYSTGGIVIAAGSWEGIQSSTDGALMRGYGLAPTGSSTGGYIDMAILGYANYPSPLAGLSSFGSNDVLLWAAAGNSTSSINSTYGLNTNAFICAASGFTTNLISGSLTNYNLFNTKGGYYSSNTTQAFTADGPIWSKTTASPPSESNTFYGMMLHKSGSQWSIWNPSTVSWFTADFAAAGFPTGAWTSYSTTSSNFTISTQDCAYLQVGKTCFVRISITGVFTGSSGSYTILTLPVAPYSYNQCWSVAAINSLSSFYQVGEAIGLLSTAITVGIISGYAAGQTYTVTVTGVYQTT